MLSWDHHDIHYVTFILHVVLTLENNKFGVPKILKINIKLSNVFELQDVNWDINLVFSSQMFCIKSPQIFIVTKVARCTINR